MVAGQLHAKQLEQPLQAYAAGRQQQSHNFISAQCVGSQWQLACSDKPGRLREPH